MADLFGRNKQAELAAIESCFLKYMAWNMKLMSFKQASQTLVNMGLFKSDEVKKMIENLLSTNKIISTKGNFTPSAGECLLAPNLHLDLLWQLKDEPWDAFEKYKSPFDHFYIRENKIIEAWRDSFFEFAKGRIPSFPKELDTKNLIVRLCRMMPLHPKWKDMFSILPDMILSQLFQEEALYWTYYLQKPADKFLQMVYLDNEKMAVDARISYKEFYSFYKYVLSGRINEIPQSVTTNYMMGICAHALYDQYHGRYKEAVKSYHLALKCMQKPFFNHSFYDMTYVLALMNDKETTSKSKLVALLKKKELSEDWDLLPARLLILFSQHVEMDRLMENLEMIYQSLAPLVKTLVALVVKHYHLSKNDFIDVNDIGSLVNKDHLKLLQLECLQDFPTSIAKSGDLKKELGLEPLFQPYQKKSEWEMAVALLMDLTEINENSVKVVALQESQSRIIYYIDRFARIIPRLQKSKNGITWSNGRNIALSTFKQQAVSDMNEIDSRLATYVRCYSSGWGGNDTWELDGAHAFAVLAGYPLVFQAENPNVPVVITKEEPQLVVTKVKDGYRVNSNVEPPYNFLTILKKENDQLYRVFELNGIQKKILETLSKVPNFPESGKKQLAELLSRLSKSITIHSDLVQSGEKLNTIKGDTLITVQLQPVGEGIKAELFVKPFTDQPPYCKAGEGAGSVIGAVKGKRVQAMRDLKKETVNYRLISKVLQKVSGDKATTDVMYFDNYYQCLDLIEALCEQTKIARTEWPEGVKLSISRSVDFQHLNLKLKGTGQWFEVEGELKVDARTQIKIEELLQKVRKSKGRFIELGNSEFLALSQQLRRQLEEMDAMFLHDKKKLKISRLNASVMADIEKMGVSLTKDKAFSDLQKRIEEAGNEKYQVPKMLQAELRGYQEEGFRWMSRLAHWGAGACLADDMGLGKTIQSIALMLSRGKKGASLVIAPASVLLNWKYEIERFAPSLTASVMHDADQDRTKLVNEASDFEVILTTYGLLTNEVELLASKTWNVIILDEAHTIKNKETKMSKAAMELNGEFRLLLTGTPLQNHLGEIWNLFQFANPGLLGSFQHFNDNFIVPIEKGEDKQRQKQLKKILLPFLLRRNKTEVLDELPEKTEIILPVELSPDERALYENLRQQAMLSLEEGSITAMQTLAEIMRLRQAACHPALVNKQLTLTSSKTQTFLKLTDELINNNHRALVFSQFTSHLALIRKELDAKGIEYLYLDGAIPVPERAALVKQFQTGEQPLFLISLRAGGTGLNLTAADYVIHLDPWWNPAVEDQASDRVHRIGQTRPVTIYRLIAIQTIEEKIIRLHQTKKSLADSLLDGSDMAHKLTKEEMLDLLREGDY